MFKLKIIFLLLAISSVCRIDSRIIKRSDSDDHDHQSDHHDDHDHDHDHDEDNNDQNEITHLPIIGNSTNAANEINLAESNSSSGFLSLPNVNSTNSASNQSTRPSELLQNIFNQLFDILREFISSTEQEANKLRFMGFDYHEYIFGLAKNILKMVKNVDELLNKSNTIIQKLNENDLNEFRESVKNQTLGELVRNYKINTNLTFSGSSRSVFDTLSTGEYSSKKMCSINNQKLSELEEQLRRIMVNSDFMIKTAIIQETFRYKSIFFEMIKSFSSILLKNNQFERLSCNTEVNITEWEIKVNRFKQYENDFISYYKCWTKQELISDQSKGIAYVLENRIKSMDCRIDGSHQQLANELNQNYSYFKWDVIRKTNILYGSNLYFSIQYPNNDASNSSRKFNVFNRDTNCDLDVFYEDIEPYEDLNNSSSEACRPFDISNFYQFLKDEIFKNNETEINSNSIENFSHKKYSNVLIPDLSHIEDSLYESRVGFLRSISVDVDIEHPYVGDLKIYLIAPNRNQVLLHDRSGGNNDDLLGNYPNTLTPAQSLEGLNGIQIRGTWLLKLYDESRGDTGKLKSWKLNFKCSTDAKEINSTNITSSQELNQTSNIGTFSFTQWPQKRINDHSTVSDSIFVPHYGYLTSVNVDVDISHTATSDLELVLQTPGGIQSIKLHSRSSGSNIIGNYPQTLVPVERLSRLYGSPINGYWSLLIKDSAGGDYGNFKSWTLNINFERNSEFLNESVATIPVTLNQTLSFNETRSPTSDFSSYPNQFIDDFLTVEDSIYIPFEGFLTSISVDVDITHPNVGDLIIHLFSPSLSHSEIILHNRSGGSNDDLKGNYPNTLTPVTSLRGLVGMQINGIWKLWIRDASSGYRGKFNYWKLNLQYSTRNNEETARPVPYYPSTVPTPYRSTPYLSSIARNDLTTFNRSGNYFTMTKTPGSSIYSSSSVYDFIYVSNEGFLKSINVDIDISHTYIGDLVIKLIAPNNQSITLHNRYGGAIDDIKGNYPRTLTPFESFNPLIGSQIKGTWMLNVSDESGGDTGFFHSWKLDLEYETTTTTRPTQPNTNQNDNDNDINGSRDDAKLFELLKEVVKSKIHLPSFNNISIPSSININFYNLFYKNNVKISNKAD